MSRVGVALVCLILSSPQILLARGPTEPAQLWSTDLSNDTDFAKRARAENSILLRPPTLDFLSNEHIIVSFDDNSSALSGLEMRPFGFHVLKVDAQEGKPGQKLSWQVQNNTSQAMAVGKGNLLVLVGEHLKKLSTTFEELASVPAPLTLHGNPTPMHLPSGSFLNPDYERWQTDVAPGGTTVVLAHQNGPEATIEWLRSSDLQTVSSTKFSGAGLKNFFAGNESALVVVHNLPPVLLMRSGKHRNLCECRPKIARFVTDELIFLAMQREYKIVTTSGEVRISGKLKIASDEFHRASGGDRFVYTTGFYKGSGFPLKTAFAPQMTVHVLDSKTLKHIAEKTFHEPVVPKGGASHGFRQSAVALSPDGHRLLVLINSTLSLYEIHE